MKEKLILDSNFAHGQKNACKSICKRTVKAGEEFNLSSFCLNYSFYHEFNGCSSCGRYDKKPVSIFGITEMKYCKYLPE
jgi:hypothetical protein